MMLTPRARASATTWSSTGTLPETMIPRSPSSIARSWMSRRSPTMISEFAAGIPSRSEIFQNERRSMVPSRTKSSSCLDSSTAWTIVALSARAMLASVPWTWRICFGLLTRGMKIPPRWGREIVPTTLPRGSTTGRSPMSCRSINSRASAQVAFSGTETTLEFMTSRTLGHTSLR